MEGPSLKITAEQLAAFKKQKVQSVEGNTKIEKEKLVDQYVKDIFSWGKHLVFQFDEYALRVHFLLWGSFKADVEGHDVTGEYYRKGVKMNPRLVLKFKNGIISFYNCSLKLTEDRNIKNTYDFSVDILSDQWNKESSFERVKKKEYEEIADVLLTQEIFSGVGNIIKNEVLYRTKTNPKEKIGNITDEKLLSIIQEARHFSQQFYEWRKKFELKKHLEIYRKSECPVCHAKVIREKTGKKERMSFYCPNCQSSVDQAEVVQ